MFNPISKSLRKCLIQNDFANITVKCRICNNEEKCLLCCFGFSPEQHLFITNNYFLIFQNICDLSDLFLGELRVDWFSYAPPYSLDIGCT